MSVFSPSIAASDEPVSEAEAQANLDTAENLVAFKLGIDNPRDVMSQDYQLHLRYKHELASVILAFPDRFTPQMRTNAEYSLNTNWGSLVDDDIDWSDFGNAFLDNALDMAGRGLGSIGRGTVSLAESLGRTIGGVGTAVENTAKAATWVVPLIAAAAFIGLVATRTPIDYSKLRRMK